MPHLDNVVRAPPISTTSGKKSTVLEFIADLHSDGDPQPAEDRQQTTICQAKARPGA
jgi:hypothetical protein